MAYGAARESGKSESATKAYLNEQLGSALTTLLSGAGTVESAEGDAAQVTTVHGARRGDLVFVGPTSALDAAGGTLALLMDDHMIVEALRSPQPLAMFDTVVCASSKHRVDILAESTFYGKVAHGAVGLRLAPYRRFRGPLFSGSVGVSAIGPEAVVPTELHAGYSFEPVPSTLGLYVLGADELLVARSHGAPLGSPSVGVKVSLLYVFAPENGPEQAFFIAPTVRDGQVVEEQYIY